jgi:glyoxylase-like metal-dependent hydrolase (beta-lactamase superfamily II)
MSECRLPPALSRLLYLVVMSVPVVLVTPTNAQKREAQRSALPLAAATWNSGAPAESALTVRRYAQNFWIIRQGKRSSSEAPFMYLIAGRDSALLLDTGAAPENGPPLPLVALIDSLLATVSPVRAWPLIVLHSHGHSDHKHYDSAFAARTRTHVIAADSNALMARLGMRSWPDAPPTVLDLGNRRLLVIATPGHQPAHVMVYDQRTSTLLSGDMLYPGLLTVRDLPAFRASALRVQAFAATHPIRHILGAHVEMTSTPREMYPLGTVVQPREHALALPGSAIHSLVEALDDAGDFMREVVRDDFILGRVKPPSQDRSSTHGMLVFGASRVFMSHLSMSRAPHNYQLVFEASLPQSVLAEYRADVIAHSAEIYSIEPSANWVLPNSIVRDTVFTAHLYRGHFERGGVRIASDVPVTVRQIVMFRRFELQDSIRPTAWFSVGDTAEQFLVHRVAGRGDVDQIVRLCPLARQRINGASVVVADARIGVVVGTETPVGRVCRVLFTERADLTH